MIGFKRENNSTIDKKIIDNIRALAIDMIDNAKSGHPGIALGAAPIISTLYDSHMMINPKDPNWINRDRFVLSAGHGSSLLYSTLFMAGFDISLDDLKDFRKIDSISPGHPEVGLTPGVDCSTGPLGQGIGNAVGMAIAEKYLEKYFGEEIINYNVYVLCGEGDLMEGVSYEACSLAGHLGLNRLILLMDSNGVTLDGSLDNSFSENIKLRFESMNWNHILVEDSEDTRGIDAAIIKAKSSDKPTIIEIKTTIGKYSNLAGTSKVHGSPLEEEDIKNIKNKLELREIPFSPSADMRELMIADIEERVLPFYEEWTKKYNALNKNSKNDLNMIINSKEPIKLRDVVYDLPEDMIESTRVASGKVINAISDVYPFLIGGSADVSNSTYAKIKSTGNFSNKFPLGRNINVGIREHAMASIGNGIALSGLTPFVSTFVPFIDYAKASVRMSALMDLPIIYVLSHDSITVGEDGPTHEAVEQLISLRSIPNFDVYRPADSNEVIGAYNAIFESRKPSAIILSRNKVPISEYTNINDSKLGGYILEEERKNIDACIISTGEEVTLALEVSEELKTKGYDIRVVSMPSIEVFERQTEEYKNSVIPSNKKIFVIEAGSSYSWDRFTTRDNMFTVDSFGYSGKKEDVLKKFGLTVENISNKIEELIN